MHFQLISYHFLLDVGVLLFRAKKKNEKNYQPKLITTELLHVNLIIVAESDGVEAIM